MNEAYGGVFNMAYLLMAMATLLHLKRKLVYYMSLKSK